MVSPPLHGWPPHRRHAKRRLLATVGWMLLAAGPALASAPPTVTIDAGTIAGRDLPAGVRAYLGIPFAAPPVAALRWREPQPVAPWTGTRDATAFAPDCQQVVRHDRPAPAMREDCLYLNVWMPPGLRGSKHPVIFYIYGGGFVFGSSAEPRVDGASMARKGIVFVSVNYRVGALGFLAHPELSAESPHKVSGNYGLLDQIAGLRWVQRNVARFGGDPANVTIMGHSAGSMSVGYLQASPLTHGLIAKGVALSGSPFFKGTLGVDVSLRSAEANGLHFQQTAGAHSLAELRALPAATIAATAHDEPSHNPVIDGYVLPADTGAIFAAGRQNDVPVMIGFTSDESFTPIGQATSLADYRERARKLFGEQAGAFLALYPATTDAEARRASIDAGLDQGIGNMDKGWAVGQAAMGKAPVYVFEFSRPPPPVMTPSGTVQPSVYHGADIPYWLGTLDRPPVTSWKAYDRTLGAAMSDALVRFVTTGSPAGSGMAWPAFDPAHPQVLELGDAVKPRDWPGYARMDFFDAFSPPAR